MWVAIAGELIRKEEEGEEEEEKEEKEEEENVNKIVITIRSHSL